MNVTNVIPITLTDNNNTPTGTAGNGTTATAGRMVPQNNKSNDIYAQYTTTPLPYAHFRPEGWLPPPTAMMDSPLAPARAEPYVAAKAGGGKHPLMVVNERWPEALQSLVWEEVQYTPVMKGYKCSGTVNKHTFHAEATSKKMAKQLLAQNIIKTLQPGLLDVCGNIAAEPTLPAEGERKRKAAPDSNKDLDPIAKRKAKILDNVEAKPPLQVFNELVSLSRLADKDNFVEPDVSEVTIPGSDPSKPHTSRYRYAIKMYGQEFEATSGNKKFAKEAAIIKALKTVYGVDLTRNYSDTAIIMKLIEEHSAVSYSVALNNILRSYSSKMGLEFTVADQEVERAAENPGIISLESGGVLVKYKEFRVQVKLGDQIFEHASAVSKRDAMEGCMFECLCKYFQLDRKMVRDKLADSSKKDSAPTKITYCNLKSNNSADVVSLKNKSPVQALYEIGVRQNLKIEFVDLKESQPEPQQQQQGGDTHTALCKCVVNDKEFMGTGKNRKLAKQDAACQALKVLFQIDVSREMTGDKPQFNLQKTNPQVDLEKSELVCKLVVAARTKYADILSDFNVVPSSTFSAFLLTDKENPDNVTVISLASGSRCNSLRRTDGTNLHDCHGAVLARRGLLLYFYQQLESLAGKTSSSDPEYNNSIFEEAKDDEPMETTDQNQQQQQQSAERPFDFSPQIGSNPQTKDASGGVSRDAAAVSNVRRDGSSSSSSHKTYRLKKRYAVHLYETAVPPGDASADPYDSLFKDALRTYQPDGIATVPLQYLMKQAAQRQTDAFNADSRSMSLSDKLLKWNVLGVQGSLLSLYLEPIYVESMVLAQTCHRQQLKKAIFGRFDPVIFKKTCPDFNPRMPSVYFASDIPPEMQRWAGAISMATSTLVQGGPRAAATSNKVVSALDNFGAEENLKAPTDYSLVWTVSTPVIEFITQDSGLELYGRPSRLSKQGFFDHYCKLRRVLPVPDMPNVEIHYNEAKQCCLRFVTAKHKFVSYLKAAGLGVWLEKSMKMGNFTLPWLSDESV